MYEQFIERWFTIRKTPNHKAYIDSLLAMAMGYYDDGLSEGQIKFRRSTLDKELKKLGYNKTLKKTCYNVSFEKIKNVLSNIPNHDITSCGYPDMRAYLTGQFLRLYDYGIRFVKKPELDKT